VTFATALGAGIVNCKRISPPRLNTTMQSVFSALFAGIGPGIGGLVGGAVMQRHGAAPMFLFTGGVILGFWALTWALDALITCGERRRAARAGGAAAPAAALAAAADEAAPGAPPAAGGAATARRGWAAAPAFLRRGGRAPFAPGSSTTPMLSHSHTDSAAL
jgi:hypothetical protein